MIVNLYISKINEQSKLPDQQRLKFKELIKSMSQEIGIGQRTIITTISEYRRKGTVSSPNKKKVRVKLTEKLKCSEKNAIRIM